MDGVDGGDATDRAERRAAELVGLISAATAELVDLIDGVLVDNLWHGWGINTPEHWVALRCGVNTGHAKRLAAAAKVLEGLPRCRAAFAAGEITEDHVAEIARAGVTAFHDEEVVGLAREATVSQLRKGLSFLPKPEPEPAVEPEPAAKERPHPHVSFGFGDDGMWGLHARLHAGDGALLEKALTAARDAEFRARHGDDADPTGSDQVSWVDALIRLGHAGLDSLDRAQRRVIRRGTATRWCCTSTVAPVTPGCTSDLGSMTASGAGSPVMPPCVGGPTGPTAA